MPHTIYRISYTPGGLVLETMTATPANRRGADGWLEVTAAGPPRFWLKERASNSLRIAFSIGRAELLKHGGADVSLGVLDEMFRHLVKSERVDRLRALECFDRLRERERVDRLRALDHATATAHAATAPAPENGHTPPMSGRPEPENGHTPTAQAVEGVLALETIWAIRSDNPGVPLLVGVASEPLDDAHRESWKKHVAEQRANSAHDEVREVRVELREADALAQFAPSTMQGRARYRRDAPPKGERP